MAEKWYRYSGENGEMVISTRIRLARNLSKFPFPDRMNDEQCKAVIETVTEAASQISGLQLRLIKLNEIPRRDAMAMVERHLISPAFASKENGAVLISDDERISIMINEEDHLRIQVMNAGLTLEESYDLINMVDTALDERLQFAFDERLGYLTQCPTNLGTGMRASLMLHLPALQEQGSIQQLAGTVSKVGLTIRGAYGEGTQAHGALYQMSNQLTLGISESNAIENLKGIALQIIEQEKNVRSQLLSKAVFEDRIWRSLGILQTARLLSNDEALKLLSNVRIGIVADILKDISLDTATALISDIQVGCLMADAGEDMSAEVRDVRRASLVRTALGGK